MASLMVVFICVSSSSSNRNATDQMSLIADEIALSLASEIAKSHNLEAIWTTTIASKLFQQLYLGYNWVLHYVIYDL